jgi:hypothetical protein
MTRFQSLSQRDLPTLLHALIAMRIQHVAQCIKGWLPDATADERQKGAALADIIEHIHWRLWHGRVRFIPTYTGDDSCPIPKSDEVRFA